MIPVYYYPVCGKLALLTFLLIERILCEIVGDVPPIVPSPLHSCKAQLGACEEVKAIGGLRIFSVDDSIYIGGEPGIGNDGVISV